jgi:HD-GYP domain-containing protein (c-di-GMP phosphodiesterase class II)
MKYRKIITEGIEPGKAAEHTIRDEDGTLLLAEGAIFDKLRVVDEMERIHEESLNAKPIRPPQPEPEPPKVIIEVIEDDESPIEVIDKIIIRIESLFKAGDIRTQKYVLHRILNVCHLIQDVCLENEDLALGVVMLEQRAKYTVRHPLRTAVVCCIVSRRLGWKPDMQISLVAAAITMNLGILELQEELDNQEAPMNRRQKDEIHKHPAAGAELLKELGVKDELWLDIVLEHHEALNGSGYPSGLKGGEIIEGARVLSLADAYCARVSGRNYRRPLSPEVAVRNIFLSNADLVDKDIALVFVKNLGVFPPGTFVKLKNGETAIVTQRGETINHPIVYTLVRANDTQVMSPIRRDTAASEDFAIEEIISREKAGVEVNKFQLWGYGIFKRAKTTMRKTGRLQSEIPAKLLDMENLSTADCVILNISETGCLLKTRVTNDRKLIVNKNYRLTFRILDKTLENVSATVRSSKGSYGTQVTGMQFMDITPEQQKHINLYLEKEAEKKAPSVSPST